MSKRRNENIEIMTIRSNIEGVEEEIPAKIKGFISNNIFY